MLQKNKVLKIEPQNSVKSFSCPINNSKQSIQQLSLNVQSIADTSQIKNQQNLRNSNYRVKDIEIDKEKQAIATQNIPVAISVPEIHKFFIITNAFLTLFYLLTLLFSSQTFFTYTSMNSNSIPVIFIVSLTIATYAVYLFLIIKYSNIRMFTSKLKGLKQFQNYFLQIKQAKSWFEAQIIADRNSWHQKEQIKRLVYESQVIDKSGKFYQLPNVISFINLKTKKSSQYCSQRENIQINQSDLIKSKIKNQLPVDKNQDQMITIVIAEYQKKYYFVSEKAKTNYQDAIKKFLSQNDHMFDSKKSIKGSQRIEFMIDQFKEKITYLMVRPDNQKQKSKDIMTKTSKDPNQPNDDSVFNLNDSNQIKILQDSQVRQKHPPQGLIYKKKKNNNEQKPLESQSKVKNSHTKSESIQQTFFVVIFFILYWTTLILGFGAFYQWFVLKKFVKSIKVTITKEIHL